MESESSNIDEDWLSFIDLDAIALPQDKISECEYFLSLAKNEIDPNKFRWLISAFFNAAYSFFEITALSAYNAYTDPENGNLIEDQEVIDKLRCYVKVLQNAKNPSFVKTAGHHEITIKLYELRKGNTHHYPLSIMSTGSSLPEDFHFGYLSGKGTPALEFCEQVMSLINQVCEEVG